MNIEEFNKTLKENIIIKIQKKHFIDFVKNHYNEDEYFNYTLKQLNNNKYKIINFKEENLYNLLKKDNYDIIKLYKMNYYTIDIMFDIIFFKMIIELKNKLDNNENDVDILFNFMLDLNWNWEWIFNSPDHPFEIYLKSNIINKSNI